VAEAERQRGIVRRSYHELCVHIAEADELRCSLAEWSSRRVAHPVYGTIRFETVATWKSMRHGTEPLISAPSDRGRQKVDHAIQVSEGDPQILRRLSEDGLARSPLDGHSETRRLGETGGP
jgi:hypothetical protein